MMVGQGRTQAENTAEVLTHAISYLVAFCQILHGNIYCLNYLIPTYIYYLHLFWEGGGQISFHQQKNNSAPPPHTMNIIQPLGHNTQERGRCWCLPTFWILFIRVKTYYKELCKWQLREGLCPATVILISWGFLIPPSQMHEV